MGELMTVMWEEGPDTCSKLMNFRYEIIVALKRRRKRMEV